jgi:hypothetical protein
MKSRQRLVLALLVASRVGAQGYDPATAFSEGRALGTGSIDRAFQGIGNGRAVATVPGFSATAPQSQYFQSGQGQLSGPGVARVTDCATLPPEADAYRRQECEAVNFVARNPSRRPAFSIDRANDPLISRANALARHPTRTATGMTAGSGGENCHWVTETTPASFAQETCTEYRPVSSNFCSTERQIRVDQQHRYQCVEQRQTVSHASCVIGQQIAVSTRFNYQCMQTVQTYESLSCRRGVSVNVGFGQCAAGSWLGRAAFVDCGHCIDPYMAMNVYCGADGRSYEVEPYRSADGVNRFDYRSVGYPWDGSYGRFPVAVAPGQSVTDHYVSDLGFGCNLSVYFSVSCNATTCTPSIRNVSSGCSSSGGTGTGSPLQLPIATTVSTWRSSECASLEERAQ